MAAKLPYIKWFPADWMADTALLSPATRGIWFDLLNSMWLMDRVDRISGTLPELARAGRCDTVQMQTAIDELARFHAAIVTQRDGCVTVICRRFQRERKERVRVAEKMRVTRQLRKCYGDVTPERKDSSSPRHPSSPEEESINTPSPCAGAHAKDGENGWNGTAYPQTVDDVLAIAALPQCGARLTREQAQQYLVFRMASDWIDAAGRKIAPGRIVWDVKKWEMSKNERKPAKPKIDYGDPSTWGGVN